MEGGEVRMSDIDTRVVEMAFKNEKFKTGVTSTISALDKLKASLQLDGASKGLDNVNKAAGQFNDKPVTDGVNRITASFSAMQAMAFGAFASIGQRAVGMAERLVSSFTIDPVKAGFEEYELKMGSIQTILANTAKHGTTLETVNHELEVLNEYADQTIYNFGDMTRNIGLFTNAGIKVEDATSMIKGFSNAAAASGTNAEQAAHAAQQLSQGLSAGKITAQDWISLTNAGMGNKNMQEGLIGIAEAMGTFTGSGYTAAEANQNFKSTLEGGWVTSDVMSTYLRIMSGDMDDAAISALGLSDDMVKMLRQQATMGMESATKVRTFTQLMGTLRESVGSGWSESFAILFGDFNEATDLFTTLSNSIGGWLGKMSEHRNTMLQEFKDMGGRTKLIEGLTDAFWVLGAPLDRVGKAFRQVFPATTADQLYKITEAFANFMRDLLPSAETLDRLQRTFAGVFAILGIGWEVVKGIARFFFGLFAGIEEGDKGILKFTATIGDFLVGLHQAIKAGGGIQNFFDTLLNLVMKLINPIKDFGQVIGNVFAGLDLGDAGKGLGEFISAILSFGSASEEVAEDATSMKDKIQAVFDFLLNIGRKVANFVQPVSDAIINLFSGMDYDQVMQGLQTGLLGGLVLVIKQLGGVLGNFSLFAGGDDGPSFLDKMKEAMDGLTDTLSAMQANLKASALIKIAAAIGILAIGVVLLANIDAQGLIRATSALTVMFIQLGIAMAVLQTMGTIKSAIRLTIMAGAMILMATALLILAAAVKVLSSMSWEELRKGMLGTTLLLGVIIGMSKGLDKSKGAIIRSAFALIIMAAALRLLVNVLRVVGEMDFEVMRQGLIGVGAMLTGLAIFTRLAKMGPKAVGQAAAIVLLSLALRLLASVVERFGEMSLNELAKGFTGIALGLVIMAASLRLMPKGAKMLFAALAVGKVASALGLIALAFKAFKDISWDQIARGLVAITGSLAVVTGALKVMPKISIGQVIALLGLAFAIKEIVNAMLLLGNLDVGQIAKSMGTFSGVMAVIVASLKILGNKDATQGAASIAIVAGSIQMLGGILAEWGAMDYESLGKGLGTLAAVLIIMALSLNLLKTEVAGAAALAIVAGALSLLVPVLVTLGAMPILAIGGALVALAGMFLILTLGLRLLQPMIPTLMLLAIAIGLLGVAVALAGLGVLAFATGLTILAAAGAAGAASIVAIVSALIGLIPMVMEQIGLGLVAFAQVIGNSGAAITGAITTILMAILDAIIRVTPKIGQTLLVLLQTLLRVLVSGIPMMVDAGMKLIIGILDGIARNIGQIVDKAADVIVNFVNGVSRNLGRIIQAGVDLIISFMQGIGDAARNNGDKLADAAWDMATGIIEGLANGLLSMAGNVLDALMGVIEGAWDSALSFLGISSPSKKFIQLGKYVTQGFVIGLTGGRKDVREAVDTMFSSMNASLEDAKQRASDTRRQLKDLQRTKQDLDRKYIQAHEDLNKARAKGEDTTSEERRVQAAYSALNKNWEAQQKLKASLAETVAEYNKVYKARDALANGMKKERQALWNLGYEYDKVTAKLDAANKKLADAKKVRDDYNKSIREQYGKQEDITGETRFGDYIKNLEKQIIDTQNYTIALTELRKRGLNDEIYKELLASGTEAMPFVQEVLAGGKGAVNQLNTLGKALDRDAARLGDRASSALYQAGVDAAEGLVKGLEKQQAAIEKRMDKIADYMVNTIKKKLGIKSPSQVFAEIGKFTVEGMARGLDDSAPLVSRSAEGVGQTAIDTMKKTISGLGTLIEGDVDMNPTIAPVLDLSNVRKDAAGIGDMLATKPISLAAAYSGAADASAGYTRNQAAYAEADAVRGGDVLNFTQNNTSPKALSRAELYRQTNNQLSVAKGALKRNAR